MPALELTLAIAVAVAAVIYGVFPRHGPHLTSRLTCPKCGRTFDYKWLPGGSFSAVRLGKRRYMRCLLCGKWSTFDVYSTRISGKDEDDAMGAS